MLLCRRKGNGSTIHFFLCIDHGIAAKGKNDFFLSLNQAAGLFQSVFHNFHPELCGGSFSHGNKKILFINFHGRMKTVGKLYHAVPLFQYMENLHDKPVKRSVLFRSNPSRFRGFLIGLAHSCIHILPGTFTAEGIAAFSPVVPDKDIRFFRQVQSSVRCRRHTLLAAAEYHPVKTVGKRYLCSLYLLHSLAQCGYIRRSSPIPVLIPAVRQGTDQSHGFCRDSRIQRKHFIFILEKNNGFPGQLQADLLIEGRIQIFFHHPVIRVAGLPVINTKTQLCAEYIPQGFVDFLLCYEAKLPGLPGCLSYCFRSVGHTVYACFNRIGKSFGMKAVIMMKIGHKLHCTSVTDNMPLQAVFLFQDFPHFRVEHSGNPVNFIISRHYAFRPAVHYGSPEGFQIQLLPVSGIYAGRLPSPARFGVVRIKMLEGSSDTKILRIIPLHALDISGRHDTGKNRIFPIAFLRSSPPGIPFQINGRRPPAQPAIGMTVINNPCLRSGHLTGFFDKIRIPCGAHADRLGERSGRFRSAQIILIISCLHTMSGFTAYRKSRYP